MQEQNITANREATSSLLIRVVEDNELIFSLIRLDKEKIGILLMALFWLINFSKQ